MPQVSPRANLPIQTREAPIASVNVEKRTADLTWTGGAQVRRYDWYRDREYLEELSLAPSAVRMERLASGKAPLLNNHGSWRSSLEDQIGVVDSATINPPSATVRFSARDSVKPILQDVQDKIIRNVSVGYITHRVEMIPPKEPNGLWVYRAVDWEPYELSLVSIPADASAEVRSGGPREGERTFPCEFITPAGAAADLSTTRSETMPTTTGTQGGSPAAESSAGNTQTTEAQRAAAEAAATAAAAATTATTATTAATTATTAATTAEAGERAGVAQLYRAAERSGLQAEFVSSRLVQNLSLDAIRNAMIDEIAKRAEGGSTQHRADSVQISEDEVLKRRGLVSNALLHRYDPRAFKLENGAGEWRGYTLRELMRRMLELRGVNTQGMSVNRMWERTMESGSDLPNIVLDAANKSLRQAYDAAPRTYELWARQVTAPDFKAINRIVLSGAPALLKVLPGEEFKRGAVSDGKETYQLATYGRITGINRQTIINDDMDAFTRIPALYARAASDLVADTVYAPILTNPLMADGTALFAAGHGNLSGSSDAISVTSLGAGRAAMRSQKGLEGRPINVAPKYLLVPVAKETIAQQQTSPDFVAQTSANINVFKGNLTPIAEPRLDVGSTVSWFMAADPSQIDTIEYAYLEGAEGVYMDSRMGFDIDGIEIKVRTDVAAKAVDYRGLYKNPGA